MREIDCTLYRMKIPLMIFENFSPKNAKYGFFSSSVFLINLTKFHISKIRIDTEKSDFATFDISKSALF
jgi:hypothetical protein